jgi:hypothetical protein
MPSFRFDRDSGSNWEQAPSIVRKDDNWRVDPLRVADPRRKRAAILLVARPSRSRPTIDGAMNSRGTPSRPKSNEVHRFACFVNAHSELVEEWSGPKRKVAFQVFGVWSVTRHGAAKVPGAGLCGIPACRAQQAS